MNKRVQLLKYLLADYFSALIAWAGLYIYRKLYIEAPLFGEATMHFNKRFFFGIILVPLFWLVLYYASGYYREVIRKSRLSEFLFTVRITFLGTIILFFGLLLDDTIASYSNFYQSFAVLLGLHFFCTYFLRLIITTSITKKIHKGKFGFNTVIIGGNEKAQAILEDIQSHPFSTGNIITGFISVNNGTKQLLDKQIPRLGEVEDIKRIISQHKVEEVIIAIEYSEHNKIEGILNLLIDTNVIVKTIPGMYEIFTGKVKMSAILGTPLIEISHQIMPAWQDNLKHFIDIVISLLALIVTLPFCIFLAIGVKTSSPGPLFYGQERIGKNGKPFKIYKFRSMYVGAEKDGPQLSSNDDKRITPFGRFMRKSRFDEIPNFFNVLRGEMSLVGPRPERQFYIDQISEIDPRYKQLIKVRPGITSWGQVKYGYAKNVEEMLRRMKYDLIYLENMSIYVDIKIMIYTVMIVVKRKGV